MMNRAARSLGNHARRLSPTPSIAVAGAALFIALGGSAIAAESLIRARDIATGAVTSKAIRNGGVEPKDLSAATRELLQSGEGVTGARGDTGISGTNGINGPNGPNGSNGPNGPDGTNGTNGTNGTDGADGTDGVNGIDGIDGTIAPLAASGGRTNLPTASPPTPVVNLTVPAGSYVVLAKTQLSHTGAGDTVDCMLKAGATTIDQVSMKTLPALAAIPVSLQAVTTTASPSQLSVECDVLTASGTASFSSLIAIPTG
jgi:Collagen triple helix repeat (20 copies)